MVDYGFQVLSMDESSSVGRISKQWTGYIQEAFTDADNFGIQFPLDLDVKIKAVLLGACFLIVSFILITIGIVLSEYSKNVLNAVSLSLFVGL